MQQKINNRLPYSKSKPHAKAWGGELCPASNERALQSYKAKGVSTGRKLGSIVQFTMSTYYMPGDVDTMDAELNKIGPCRLGAHELVEEPENPFGVQVIICPIGARH